MTRARTPLSELCAQELSRLETRDLRRSLTPLASAPGPTVEIDGQSFLLMCSNNYLGLATDPRLAHAAARASAVWGTGAGASRLISGSTVLHSELESRLARLKGTQDCVLFSSGYLANVGTISALLRKNDIVLSDCLNHASIIDGCRLSGAQIRIYKHADAEHCARLLQAAHEESARKKGPEQRVLIVTDTVFSMDGDLAPLPDLVRVAREAGAFLMVDEAHATGILGQGRGAVAAAGLEGQVDIIMGTCSKALGALGGFIAGSREFCDFLRNRARSFIFDTALPGPIVAAVLAALEILEEEPARGEQVRRHAHRLTTGIRALGYTVPAPAAAIVPVIIGSSTDAISTGKRLSEHGIFARPIRPPTVPEGTARIRLCPMATHTDADIDRTIAAFA